MIFKLNKNLYEIKEYGKEVNGEKTRKIAFILNVSNIAIDVSSRNIEGDGYGYLDLEEKNKLDMYKEILKKFIFKVVKGNKIIMFKEIKNFERFKKEIRNYYRNNIQVEGLGWK